MPNDNSDKFDRVRKALENPEDVDLPDGLSHATSSAGGPDDACAEGPEDGRFDEGWDGVDRGAPPAGPPDGQGDDLPPEARCVDFPLNDYGNGLRLVEHFGSDLIWVSRVGWFLWTGQVWRADPDGIAVRRLAFQLTDLIARECWHMPMDDDEAQVLRWVEEASEEYAGLIKRGKDRDEDANTRLHELNQLRAQAAEIKDKRDKSVGRRLTHAKNAGNTNALGNLMKEGGTIIARALDELDATEFDVNTQNGVLRFWHEVSEDDQWNPSPHPGSKMAHLPHDRDFLLTKMMPVDYDPAAKCPQFDAFLERVQPLPEMRRFLRRWFGLSMTGFTGEHKFVFLYGDGRNGKSVLVDTIAKIMGNYAASAKIESLTGRNKRGGAEATPDLVPLIGARFVRTSEPEAGERLQEGLIKQLTGGEPLLIRALQQDFVEVYPIFKLTMSGNHKPEIHGGDDGIWQRVLLIPFAVQIPKEERDLNLGRKLFEERSGILNWLIAGLHDYMSNGLQIPAGVTAATDEYREESDPLGTFLTSCCAVTGDPEHTIKAKDLSEAFMFWMDDAGMGGWKKGTVFKKIKAAAGKFRHPNSGQIFHARKSSESFYDGIALLEPFKTRFENWQSVQANKVQGKRFDDY